MPVRTPLFAVQQASGGKMVDFAGWEMAVQFAGIGPEHAAVRTAAGAFDVCHMGRLRLSGPGALAFLERRTCRALADLAPGRVRYSLALADDGGAIDDLLISREAADRFHVVCNAGNRANIITPWQAEAGAGVVVEDLSAIQGMVAVQGPKAPAILAGLGLDPAGLKNYAFRDATWRGQPIRISRTGYTGEDGAELMPPAGLTADLWQAVVAAGVAPCGLGARDTLRLEAAMPLYGHELDRGTTPVEAGLDWVVNKAGGFIGAERVLRQLAEGPARRLVGLRMVDKRVPRQGYAVLHDGATVGQVTSGTLSPTLGMALGMAFVAAKLAAPGTRLAVDVRGQVCAAEVVALPFYKRPRG